jgi:hypothetical protein
MKYSDRMAIDSELSERLSVVCTNDDLLCVVVIQQVLDVPQYHPEVLNVTLPHGFEVVAVSEVVPRVLFVFVKSFLNPAFV